MGSTVVECRMCGTPLELPVEAFKVSVRLGANSFDYLVCCECAKRVAAVRQTPSTNRRNVAADVAV